MSIASELSRIQQAKSDLATSIENKGVTVPAATTLDGYAALVDQIQQGGTLPYDAEIAYLESTGTQWIDTGISPTTNTEVHIILRFNRFVTSSMLCAARTGTSNQNRFFPFAHSKNGEARCDYGTTEYYKNITYGTIYEVLFNETSTHKCYIDGTSLGTLSGYTKTNNETLYFFGTSGYGSTHYLGEGRIYRCVIKEGGVTVRDFIPVRVGTVGYMYDKVYGNLYGNAGTGNFNLGSDF